MIDAFARETHYLAHLAPVWAALPPALRGTFYVDPRLHDHPKAVAIGARPIRSSQRVPKTASHVLVAGIPDMRALGRRRFILLEHGAGQAYGGDPCSAMHPSYSGGSGRHLVDLFLCPNGRVAARNLERYPEARAAVVGCPRLDVADKYRRAAQKIPADPRPTVAISFHFDCRICPESRWAWPHYAERLETFAAHHPEWRVVGHAHPRARRHLNRWWREVGVEVVDDVDELLGQASVLCMDNSSVIFEAAALGIPVVLLNAPWYRREVEHGLRFWDAASVGVRVDEPGELSTAVALALTDPPEVAAERSRIARQVYEVPVGGGEWESGRGGG